MKRIPALDVLRALAVLLVLISHCFYPTRWQVAEGLIRGGWVGVDLFFVLSGFLVSTLLFQEWKSEGDIRWSRFWVRRQFKIYPTYLVLLIADFFLYQRTVSDLPALGGHMLFIHNYGRMLQPHTWSLAVEEHFYFALPLLLPLLLRNSKRPILRLSVVYALTAVLCLLGRGLTPRPYEHVTHLIPTHLRLDTLSLGVLLGGLYCFETSRLERFCTRWRGPLLALGVICLGPAFIFPRTLFAVHTIGFSVFAVGSAALLLAVLHSSIGSTGAFRMLSSIGKYSYAIYLFHWPIGRKLVPFLASKGHLPSSFVLIVTLYMALSIGMGMMLSHLIEWPILRWRDRRIPSRSKESESWKEAA